jgi:V/A-type H+-transporting ATPase subunit A
MPVAAREASIYTGITIAEYYRDMGYHVAIMADSTSRWAEALREISGRLEEMPAEEGFPAYLPSRISEFYERAGFMDTLSHQVGSVTIVGAVSPQGADFSEPVTQNTKRFVRAFWALDKALAYSRHYPAINWNISYSEYIPDLTKWYQQNVSKNFLDSRKEVMKIMAEENKLLEIAKLIGTDVLPDDQRLIITIGKVIRNGFLQQNSFHKDDTFVSLTKQLKMMEIILYLYRRSILYLSSGRVLRQLLESGIFEDVIKIKYDIPNDNLDLFVDYYSKIDKTIEGLR